MSTVRLIVLAIAVVACSPGATTTSSGPAVSAAPSSVAGSAAPASSGACIDRGLLADTADGAAMSFQALAAAIKANKMADASNLAGNAATQMRSLADVVEKLRPLAATALRTAADKLDTAKADMAGAASSIPAIETAFNGAYDLAMEGACPG
jgi:hypothetical protein